MTEAGPSRSLHDDVPPPRTRSRPGWLRALSTPPFRRMWVVATLQQFGYWFSSIAFQWLVALKTNHDALTLSLLYFCVLVPILLFSLPAGVLADLRDRRRIVLATQLAILLISTGTATLVFLDHAPVWALMACGFAVGSAHAVATPASQALVANSVPAEDLRSAVMLQAIGMNLARILGPTLAGILILVWGSAESLLTYGALGLVSILVLRKVPRPGPERAAKPRQGLASQIGSGLAHARTRPPAAIALAIVGMTSLFGASYLAQMPALAARVSDDPAAFPVLTSIGGVGALAGVLSVAVRRPGVPTVAPAAVRLALLGGAVVGLGLSRLMWLEMVLVAVAGGLQFGIMTQCGSVIQQVVDDGHRGRVMGLYMLCWGGLLPLGGLMLGTGWHVVGPLTALGVSGCVALVFACFVLRRGAVLSVAPVPDGRRAHPPYEPLGDQA